MDTNNESNRVNEPLMAPLEEVERRAYPAQGDSEPYGSEAVRDDDGLLPDVALPTATGQPLPAPAPQDFGDGSDVDDDVRRRMR